MVFRWQLDPLLAYGYCTDLFPKHKSLITFTITVMWNNFHISGLSITWSELARTKYSSTV